MDKKNSWAIFNQIAPTYDHLNQLLSLGIDHHWRNTLSKKLPSTQALSLLDLGTGTGDIIFSLWKKNKKQKFSTIVGLDLSEKMLAIAKQKTPKDCPAKWELGDACNIPYGDNSFDIITMSFALRNVPDLEKVLQEIHRVLRPKGKVLILEFSLPKNPLIKWGYLFYLRKILPLIGGWVSGNKAAYIYLNKTIESFPYGKDLVKKLKATGLHKTQFTPLSLGIVSLYEGQKP